LLSFYESTTKNEDPSIKDVMDSLRELKLNITDMKDIMLLSVT